MHIHLDWSSKRVALLAFVVILATAAVFRLDLLNLAEFKGDEAGTSFVVRNLVQHGVLPLVGPPLTTGGNDGPFYYYLLALPFAISTNPIALSAFVAVLNLLGIVLTFKFADEFFNRRVALIATALDAVSPFAVLFSRKIWNPDVVFPFAIIVLYCLYSFAVKKKSAYLVPLFVAYAALAQIHSIALFLGPAILFFLVKFRTQIKLSHLAVAVLLVSVVFSPMIYGLSTSGSNEGGAFASTLHNFGVLDPRAVADISAITGGTGFDYILGNSASLFYSTIFNVNQLLLAESVLLLLGLVYLLYMATKNTFGENVRYSLLFAWIAIPMLILLFFNPPYLLPHEVTILFPANFLAVAIFLDALMSKRLGATPFRRISMPARGLAAAVLLLILVAQVIFAIGFLAFLNSHGGTGGDYGVGLQYKQEVASYIAFNSGGRSFTISSDLIPGDIGTEYTYLLSLYGKVPSDTATLNYVVIDNLSYVSPALAHRLANGTGVDFGPLTVYNYST